MDSEENEKVKNTSEKKENEEKKEENSHQQQNKNLDYYDEQGKPRYEDIINYENEIRKEIEQTTPLVSDLKPTSNLQKEFENSEYSESIKTIINKSNIKINYFLKSNFMNFIHLMFCKTIIINIFHIKF